MKLAFIGTYPPQKCGIGTFTNNLIRSAAKNFENDNSRSNLYVIAVSDNEQLYNYPPEVSLVVNQNVLSDYEKAANFINGNQTDVCILEHEFGIFGGESGVFVLSLAKKIEKPLIVTFHTVIKEPSRLQNLIVKELSKIAYKVIVMSRKAVKFLVEIYGIPLEKIEIIEHGVPVRKSFDRENARKKFNFKNKTALFTFGLLSRNKGIETVINALPEVVDKHKNLIYVVLGNTHPKVLSQQGEEYRDYLLDLVREKGLEEHVFFYKNFVPEQLLMEYLCASDIYITPYLNEAQITSGTLSYAVGAGNAVISTPYWHAQELLADGRGMLFDFNNHKQLGGILLDLLDKPEKIRQLRDSAMEYGNRLEWPKIGAKYKSVVLSAAEEYSYIQKEKQSVLSLYPDTEFAVPFNKKFNEGARIIQKAEYGIQNIRDNLI
jgi:glycosyltransferase involved in cell wall biosynthesis